MFRILNFFLIATYFTSFGQEIKEVQLSQSIDDSTFVRLNDFSNEFVLQN